MMILKTRRLLGVALAVSATMANAGGVVFFIGDDDGFGGTQGATSNAGDGFANFSSPSIAPGAYFNAAGTDSTTQSPWSPYTFTFQFAWDTTGLSPISEAKVSFLSGSVARRTDGSGFGFADVIATSGGSSLNLGNFLTASTGATASSLEESVKLHTFDVLPLITGGTSGLLTIRIDGTILNNPVDQFSLDYGKLSIVQTVPEPSVALLLAAGIIGLMPYVRFKGCAKGKPR